MPTTRVGDINIYYEVHGEGEALVLVIGHGSNSLRWFRQVPVLSKEYRVVIFDNRGAGRSDKPDIPYTVEMMAGDIAGLLDAIGIDAAHIYGTALGGMIVQEFALHYPEKVISLILGCAFCGGPHTIRQDTDATTRRTERQRLEQLPREERVRQGLLNMFSQQFIDSNPETIEQFVANAVAFVAPPYAIARQAEAVRSFDTYDRLPSLRMPALVIAGVADRIIPSENSRLLASRIPGAELIMLENKGHGYYVEAADEVNSIVLDFLRRHPRSG